MAAVVAVAAALAYAPLTPLRGSRSSAATMAVSDLPGISTEVGNVVWDPLGLSDNMDDANLKLVRAAELKHGRIAMLAVRAPRLGPASAPPARLCCRLHFLLHAYTCICRSSAGCGPRRARTSRA